MNVDLSKLAAGVMALDIYATRKATSRHRAVTRYKRLNRIPTLSAASTH